MAAAPPARKGSAMRRGSMPGAPAKEAPEDLREGRTVNEYLVNPPDAEGVMFFIHGALGHLHQWDAQLTHFAKRKHRLRVVAWDAYGCGDSDKPDTWSAYAEDELLADARAMWDKHFMEGKRNILVGHSFGSALAVRLSCQDGVKDHLAGLALLGTAPNKPAASNSWIFRMPSWAMGCVRGSANKAFIDNAFHKSSSEDLKREASEQAVNNPWHVIKAFYRQMQWDVEAYWASIRAPVLLVTGASDGICPFGGARRVFDTLSSARLGLTVSQLNAPLPSTAPRRASAAADMGDGPTRRPSFAAGGGSGRTGRSSTFSPARPGRGASSSTPGDARHLAAAAAAVDAAGRRGSQSPMRKQSGAGTAQVSIVTAKVQETLVKGYTAARGTVQLTAVGQASHQVMQEQPRVVNVLLTAWLRDYAMPRVKGGAGLLNGEAPGLPDPNALAGTLTGAGGGMVAPVLSGDASTAEALLSSGMAAHIQGGRGMGPQPAGARGRSGSVVSSLSAAMMDSDSDEDEGDGFGEALHGMDFTTAPIVPASPPPTPAPAPAVEVPPPVPAQALPPPVDTPGVVDAVPPPVPAAHSAQASDAASPKPGLPVGARKAPRASRIAAMLAAKQG